MGGRVVLLVTSPRLPAGLLTAQAWDLVRSYPVYAADVSQPAGMVAALREAGVDVQALRPAASDLLAQVAAHGTVVWLVGPAGDQDLTRELGMALVREPAAAEMELMYGSWDPAGARLLDAVAVVERLSAPGGDPWLGQFTGSDDPSAASRLAHYLLEEAYETYDAIGSRDSAAIREELGDLLFQVLLHAKIAERAPAQADRAGLDQAERVAAEADRAEPDSAEADATVPPPSGERISAFDIDDVAGDLVGKLVRRNPHVFGGAQVADIEEITRNWEQIKRAEKARSSCVDGIAMSQPALALAAKVLTRVERADNDSVRTALSDALLSASPGAPSAVSPGTSPGDLPAASPGDLPAALPAERSFSAAGASSGVTPDLDLGARLFSLVAQAHAAGLDPEAALRRYTMETIEAIRRAEPSERP